jgi:cytoskeletal protein RodZ
VILAGVSIGGSLAEARQRAGLTVADVGARTRIRESLIRAIERDDFDVCGGDFYARGHIRAIAEAVGEDPRRLAAEYDATHPGARPVTLEELPGRARRRWLAPVVYLVCLVLVGFGAIWLTRGTGGSPAPAGAFTGRAAVRAPTASAGPQSAPTPGLVSPTPPPAPAAEVTPVSAAAFGPGGTSDGDNPRNASLALSGDPATPWQTDWYSTARFGNLQGGTGLLVGLGRTVTASGVTIQLGSMPGADLQVRAGTSLSDMPVVAGVTDAGGTVRLPLASHPRVRYLLIWFSMLPPDSAGTYQADVSTVTVEQ